MWRRATTMLSIQSIIGWGKSGVVRYRLKVATSGRASGTVRKHMFVVRAWSTPSTP